MAVPAALPAALEVVTIRSYRRVEVVSNMARLAERALLRSINVLAFEHGDIVADDSAAAM